MIAQAFCGLKENFIAIELQGKYHITGLRYSDRTVIARLKSP